MHTILPTRLGELTIVRDGEAIVGLYFPHHWYPPDPSTFGPRTEEGFGEVVTQLQEYLAGDRTEFDLPLDPRGSDLRRRVWRLVAEVPFGQTTTYGDLARRLGHDLDPQQVGAAVGRNPLCILVPCHRVVGSGGKLTGYAGGLRRKRALLDLEQLTLLPRTDPDLQFQPDQPRTSAAAPPRTTVDPVVAQHS
ncbi:methylated-DNA--[protein]-cysteine S-methyltransferase [Actinophytocola sp.]|uniref:methylated-DNA--[protein]-cysteine S-methyltransferase n=1 Tax=Actinophytocola sp. TaxID=1872138 RepID=UPI002D264D7C|nr:methylated-DNA--[protein]-cysteine S-methyltransferase [Actinophytocola sp.]HYQ63474.1 methylated-DNA--[protein]-cysteine S-methyltransferase [Actinophytocola sp.]